MWEMWERCSTSIQDIGGVSKVQRKAHKRFGGSVGTQRLWGHLQPKRSSWDSSLGLREKQWCQASPDHEIREGETQITTFWGSKWKCAGWLYSREMSVIHQMFDQDYSTLKQNSIPWLWVSSRDALWWGIDVPLSWFYCLLFCLTLNKKEM